MLGVDCFKKKCTRKLLLLGVIGLIIGYFIVKQKSKDHKELVSWLDKHGFSQHVKALGDLGVQNLDDVILLSADHSSLSKSLERRKFEAIFSDYFTNAVKELKSIKTLEYWLISQGLGIFTDVLVDSGINSLEALRDVPDKTLQQLAKKVSRSQDYSVLQHQLKKLRFRHSLVTYYSSPAGFKALADQAKWTVSSFVWFFIFPGALLVTMMIFCGGLFAHRSPHVSKAAILDYFNRRYPAPQYCTVKWDWTEPHTVGGTLTFQVQVFQRNGKPYPVSNGDNILVEIVHQGIKVATTMEYGGPDPNSANIAKVSFTIYKSGEYLISILIGGRHIKGSPFKKNFEAGPIDATKSGFMNYSSTVVCTKGTSHPLTIETRDTYGNLSAYKAGQHDFFKIKVREAGSNQKYVPTTQIICDPQSKRLTMHIRMHREGCFQAVVTYGDVKLCNGDFNILVLSSDDTAQVCKALAKKSHNLWYEARLTSCNHEVYEKAKKVYVYISPKQLTLKEFYLKFIGKKLFTFRVCPSTKFHFNGFNNQYEAPVFTIDDGSQPPITLAAKERNIIAATFTNFLLKNIGGSETFQDKQGFFQHEIRQLHIKRKHSGIPVKIDRSKLRYSSYKATKSFDLQDWCKNFEITFQGEEGLDWGGLRREWFELLCTDLFDPTESGLFTRFTDSPQALVHPNPQRPPELKLKYYEFAGKIVGKCLYETALGGTYKQFVKARFSRSFLAQLIGLRINYKHFESDDPELYETKIKFIEENSVEDLELYMVEEEYDDTGHLIKMIDLVPNGSKVRVTNKNKLQYLDLLAQQRLTNSVREEVEYFLRGLNELIPDNLLSIFDENELELLMCGTGNYSISDFKVHHVVCGSSLAFLKVLDWFWTIVASFTEEQMARLLQFITGSSLLPPGGFAELNPKIQLTTAVTYGNLPTAHTCFNQLCLPDYDSIEQFHKALLLAITEGNQGFGLV
ncbi:apoptosis-resistant E3 ubiquitin protein ligase 1-like [Liolophura sinensis]|uniref:apoptosis-resistant E3 ubiquitin protein ligase 1-like n=1 Tax=Liolophura sinensis TaxID=3198878 RepID=UPI0031583963